MYMHTKCVCVWFFTWNTMRWRERERTDSVLYAVEYQDTRMITIILISPDPIVWFIHRQQQQHALHLIHIEQCHTLIMLWQWVSFFAFPLLLCFLLLLLLHTHVLQKTHRIHSNKVILRLQICLLPFSNHPFTECHSLMWPYHATESVLTHKMSTHTQQINRDNDERQRKQPHIYYQLGLDSFCGQRGRINNNNNSRKYNTQK